ncbi:metallophosphoesterase, partial [candidate division WOR-3 bacterium]|nr:metallophosphoesterase [candidate division WOR-3 bacterium]
MKILHTADIHLKEYGDERWEALKSLIEIGKKERVDIFIIAGDLFDKGVSAVKLRGKIRSLFSNIGFKV